jgi:hypothetical protein
LAKAGIICAAAACILLCSPLTTSPSRNKRLA